MEKIGRKVTNRPAGSACGGHAKNKSIGDICMEIIDALVEEFSLKREHAQNIINLIDEGNTIPFIARYRKEMTGSCDDQILRSFSDRLT